jgi:hypothetical protein
MAGGTFAAGGVAIFGPGTNGVAWPPSPIAVPPTNPSCSARFQNASTFLNSWPLPSRIVHPLAPANARVQ